MMGMSIMFATKTSRNKSLGHKFASSSTAFILKQWMDKVYSYSTPSQPEKKRVFAQCYINYDQ